MTPPHGTMCSCKYGRLGMQQVGPCISLLALALQVALGSGGTMSLTGDNSTCSAGSISGSGAILVCCFALRL